MSENNQLGKLLFVWEPLPAVFPAPEHHLNPSYGMGIFVLY